MEPGSSVGTLKVPEREGILRAIDGQHRLLALHADIEHFGDEPFTVPAVIFDRLPDDHVVQMFVTINAKHTRLNASHLVSLSGRQLYSDESLAAAHDIVRALNDREDSPLYGEIKLLGVGKGRVAQAPLAQELKKLFAADAFGPGRKGDAFREESKRFFVNYLKQAAQVFGAAWNGRKYSIKSATALRAFIRVAPGRRAAARSGACGSHGLPGHRPRHRSVGPTHRRPAVRDRRGLEARGDDGRLAVEGAAAGAAVSGRRGAVVSKKKGIVRRRCPCGCAGDPAPQQLTAPCRKYSGRLHPPIEQVVYRLISFCFRPLNIGSSGCSQAHKNRGSITFLIGALQWRRRGRF